MEIKHFALMNSCYIRIVYFFILALRTVVAGEEHLQSEMVYFFYTCLEGSYLQVKNTCKGEENR